MVPVLFPGLPGGVELLVILLIMIILLGRPLCLLVVGGFGFWKLSRGDDDDDEETVEDLRRRVDELESQLSDAGDRRDAGARSADANAETDEAGDATAGDPDDRTDRTGR